MEGKIATRTIQVTGMTCPNCEIRIENKLKKLSGVINVKANYVQETVDVTFDIEVISYKKIIEAIESQSYKVRSTQTASKKMESIPKNAGKSEIASLIGIGIIIFAVYFILKNTGVFSFLPEVSQSMGYGILFVIGLLTSVHCVAMCGGINLSQCISSKTVASSENPSTLMPSILYNSGRVLSYTLIGGVVGAVGSVIGFSSTIEGLVVIFAGAFMIIMGLNMLNIFPSLRKLTPKIPKFFGNKIHGSNGKYGPFIVGMMNGLMPCGPLQTMQIYALGTGSFAAGAFSMFVFSLGTVPLMFGFGAVSSLLSSKFTQKMMKVSAMLVMILGFAMLNRGLNLSGIEVLAFGLSSNSNNATAEVSQDTQYVTTQISKRDYPPITVQKGVPVVWTIQAEESDLTGCNSTMVIPEYGIEKELKPGDNIIEFTPTEMGEISYSCWMGMVSSSINVVDSIDSEVSTDTATTKNESSNINETVDLSSFGFTNSGIPTDDIQVATEAEGVQIVNISVDDYGYSPAVAVVEKGKPFKIVFDAKELTSCNYYVSFHDYDYGIDLTETSETPVITAEKDIPFQCGMGMLNGYIKVVDDINNVDLAAIKTEVDNYVPVVGDGCCG